MAQGRGILKESNALFIAASVKTPRHKAVASNSRRHDLHYRCILLSFPGLGLGGSKSTLLIPPSVTGSSLETGGAGKRNLFGSTISAPVVASRRGNSRNERSIRI